MEDLEDLTVVNMACRDAACGKLTPEVLYVHLTGLPHPLILRIYEGCARTYIGVVEEANVVKLNRRMLQISHLYLAIP